MTILPQDIYALFVEESHQHGVVGIEVAPEGQLGLQDDAGLVGSRKSSLRRAPAVEAHMVQPVVRTYLHIMAQGV